MPEPESKEDVKRLLGFIQFLSWYLPGLSTVDAPLRELEKSDVLFHWDHPQKKSFEVFVAQMSFSTDTRRVTLVLPRKTRHTTVAM